MKKRLIVGMSLAAVLVAVYFLDVRYGVRDGQDTYQGRTAQYSKIAVSVLSDYPSRHNGVLPKSLEDPDLQEPVSWSYAEIKQRVAFNTLHLGRQESSLTKIERTAPFIIEKEIRPSGTIAVCDYNGDAQRLTPAELETANLTPEARAELAAVLPKKP